MSIYSNESCIHILHSSICSWYCTQRDKLHTSFLKLNPYTTAYYLFVWNIYIGKGFFNIQYTYCTLVESQNKSFRNKNAKRQMTLHYRQHGKVTNSVPKPSHEMLYPKHIIYCTTVYYYTVWTLREMYTICAWTHHFGRFL